MARLRFAGTIPKSSSALYRGGTIGVVGVACVCTGFSVLTTSRATRIASCSSSAKKSATPEIRLCMVAPPSSSSLAISLVAIFTNGGPAKNTFAAFFCIMV